MRLRTRVVLAWALWLVTFGCCAAGLLVTLAVVRPLTLSVLGEGAAYAFFLVLGSATVGLVLALRRPGNPIGWLYGGAGLAWAYAIPVTAWVGQLVREHRPVPPVAQFIYIAGDWSWAPAIALGVTLPALLLPNGHLRSRRWRLVVVTSVTGAAVANLAAPLVPGPSEELGIDNPFGLAGPAGRAAAVLTIVGVLLHWLSLPPAAVCMVLRFRSSGGVERQQLRWVAAGAAAPVVGLLLSVPSGFGITPESTGASTGAATTPPAPSRGSRPACGTRWTWTPCTRSWWRWSTRPCSPPGPRCGSAAPPERVDGGFRLSGAWAMLWSGAVPRPTFSPVLTPPARGGKGDPGSSGRWSSALSAGATGAWVPQPPAG